MIWSFSNHNIFRWCQRQWYYKRIHASWRAKDPLRQETWRLSKLLNINAWRGRIVDKVISDTVVPAMNNGRRVPVENALRTAKYLFDNQKRVMYQANSNKKLVKFMNDSYAGFHESEYGVELGDDAFQNAWSEIENAMFLFYESTQLWDLMKLARLLVPQRALMFKHDDLAIRAVPDVIGFFLDRHPMIIDWKVHSRAIRDYWLQLATYAIALSRCNPHRDWVSVPNQIDPCEVQLVEAQLLTNDIREHSVSEEDIEDVEELISCSTTEMLLAMDGKDSKKLKPEDFPAAFNPTSCQLCHFRKVCWGDQQ